MTVGLPEVYGLYVRNHFIDDICNIRLSRFHHTPVALVLVINEAQGRFVAGIVIPEYQLAALVLADDSVKLRINNPNSPIVNIQFKVIFHVFAHGARPIS